MDNTKNPNSKNILMELESLKSKQCIFKMKESNYIKDKEILEDSIKTLQNDLQLKTETIRSLRKDLDAQSSNLYRDIAIKNDELEKYVMENNDLTKKLTIALETIEHHVKRNETMRAEFEKQKSNFDRESECKSKLVEFFEASSSQKETKILSLTSDLNCLKSALVNTEAEYEQQKLLNESLLKNIEDMKNRFLIEQQDKEQELTRAKHEILQLQQNGISELHLEKMNPVAATTLKALKSSKNLMDIYSELHAIIGERDHLLIEKNRLHRNNEELESRLNVKKTEIEKLTIESSESLKVTDSLKSRLLCLVSELRTSETKRGKMEREVLLAKRKLEYSEQEVLKLMEQVRVMLVAGDGSESIKQEPVDVDSAMYTSVQELQEVNRVLRNDNDGLRARLEESESEQFKQRCNELQIYSDSLRSEVEHLRHENTSTKNINTIHEKQVQMLRYLIELKFPGSSISIEKALRSIQHGIKNNVGIVEDHDQDEDHVPMDDFPTVIEETNLVSKLENDISDILDNKRASDQVYVTSIEAMRSDYVKKTRLSIDLIAKLEELEEKFKEERQINEKYRAESDLLRSINKNLSQNSAFLEAQIDDFKLKLECKITQCAEKKAELDNCTAKLSSCRSQLSRLQHERDELKKTLTTQEEILTNISSLQNVANLKDHLCLSNMQCKVQDLERTVSELNLEIKEREESICDLRDQLSESKALEAAYNESAKLPETCDVECQVVFDTTMMVTTVVEETQRHDLNVDHDRVIVEYQNLISNLESQIKELKAAHQLSTEQMEKYTLEINEINQKCDFYESQLNILEKSKQEVLNENIKLTEEAHDLNANLKLEIHKQQEDLSKMKVRLEEAENVERTAQAVIDRYVKECTEAKAKYKRELTLHAADSKQLEKLNREIEKLQSKEDDGEEKCQRLKMELDLCEEKMEHELAKFRSQMEELEQQLRDSELRNDRFYKQIMQCSEDNGNVVLNEIIEDLRGQVTMVKLSQSLSSAEKEKYDNEIGRMRRELEDLRTELSLEKDKSSLNISGEGDSSSNIEAEILKESNHVLREQKTQLDRLVLSKRTEVEDLVLNVSRLKDIVFSLEGQNNALVTAKGELEEERNRWKERCTKLIERAEQMDPEKYRVACNDRDRFEKQLLERERNVKEMDAELSKAREEIQVLLKMVEEEKNRVKKEENIGLQLKDIARRYKSETEKKRQTILELETLVSELRKENTVLATEKEEINRNLADIELKLVKEKELVVLKVEAIEEKLRSEEELSKKKEEQHISEQEIVKLELESQIKSLLKEKNDAVSNLNAIEVELGSNLKFIEELKCRCELLEQLEKEKTSKFQLAEKIIIRLQEENRELKSSQFELNKIIKRGNDEKLENEPELKRQKMNTEEVKESSSEDDEEEEEEEETSQMIEEEVDDEAGMQQKGSDSLLTDNAGDGAKIWWNVNNNADDELVNQIQLNLNKYEAEEGEYEDSDEEDIIEEHFDGESLDECMQGDEEEVVENSSEAVVEEDNKVESVNVEENNQFCKEEDNKIELVLNEVDEKGAAIVEDEFVAKEGYDNSEEEEDNRENVHERMEEEEDDEEEHYYEEEEGEHYYEEAKHYDREETHEEEEEGHYNREEIHEEEEGGHYDREETHEEEEEGHYDREETHEEEEEGHYDREEMHEEEEDEESDVSSVVVIEDDSEDESEMAHDQGDVSGAITIDLNTSEEMEEKEGVHVVDRSLEQDRISMPIEMSSVEERHAVGDKGASESDGSVNLARRGRARILKRRAGN